MLIRYCILKFLKSRKFDKVAILCEYWRHVGSPALMVDMPVSFSLNDIVCDSDYQFKKHRLL